MKKLFLLALLVPVLALAGVRDQKLFNAYNVASATYVYDEAGGDAVTDGWITDIGGHVEKGIVVQIAAFAAASIEVRIEGSTVLSTGEKVRSVIYTHSYTATETGDYIRVVEHLDEIRVGVKVTTDAGDQSVTVVYHHSTGR